MEAETKTAKEYWKEKFDEYPQNDNERLAVAMMAEYREYSLQNINNTNKCLICGKENKIIFNINFKPKNICQLCADSISLQNITDLFANKS